MKQFIHFIKSCITIEDDSLNFILSHFREIKILKERFLLKKGQTANDYFYVVSGGFRVFYDHQEKQITAWIALENSFFTDLHSTKTQTPSRFNIQAIEDSVVLAIECNKMEQLYDQFPEWQKFGRKIWEEAFLNVVDGAIKFQSMTAEERYLSEMQQSEFLQRIPLKQLASFLGITPSSLSRLRKKIK